MKYSLDCHIRTNNDGIRNAVKQLIPDASDSRVWDGEYQHSETEDEGVMAFSCAVRFNVEADRAAVVASVKGLAGIINACEVGSFVREHKCYHDEEVPKACEEETILRKV
jgi:hypothetical protein